MKTDYYEQLIDKYIRNDISAEEKEILDDWFQSIDLSNQFHKLDDERFSVLKMKIHKEIFPQKTIPLWKICASVACVIVICFLSYNSLLNKSEDLKNGVEHIVVKDTIVPAQSKGTLITNEGEELPLDQLSIDSNYIIGEISIARISESVIKVIPRLHNNSHLQKIVAPKGGSFTIVLEDGSKVKLNANSSITFPSGFSHDKRIVYCDGEVYFDVNKDKSRRPFIVKLDDVQVEVLGTKFNVRKKKDGVLRTSLFEGSVRVSHPKFSVNLTPGEEMDISSKREYTVKNFNSEYVGAWHKGEFSLDNKNIVEIMTEIAEWYNVEVVYDNIDMNVRYRGSVSRFSDINTVLDILSLAKGNEFEIKERRIMVR